MRNQIESEFNENISRVSNLIIAFQELENNNLGDAQARKDILRAAVVLMHSTLEEVIRNVYLWLLPKSPIENLNKIPFVGHEASHRAKGILLGELSEFKGMFVENIITSSIDSYVDTINLNNTTQLTNAFEMVSIQVDSLRVYFPEIENMMRRRHQIVHQMDRLNNLDPQLDPITDITIHTVTEWKNALDALYNQLLAILPVEN